LYSQARRLPKDSRRVNKANYESLLTGGRRGLFFGKGIVKAVIVGQHFARGDFAKGGDHFLVA
jgi:hypothetical protein